MWSEIQTISGNLLGSTAVPGAWSFPLAAQTVQFYKAVRIVGVQCSFICTNANGIEDSTAEIYLNLPPDKNQNFGTFGGVVHGFCVRVGSDISHVVEIDIPANFQVTMQGTNYLYAVSGSPLTGIAYIDLLYKVKSF